MPLALPSALTIALILSGVFSAGMGTGALIMHWKASGTISKLQGNNNLLTEANTKCASDIETVQAAVKAMESVSAERERQAAEGMNKAQPEANTHTAKIIRIKGMPAVSLDMQCEAIKQEQIEYVQGRRNDDH